MFSQASMSILFIHVKITYYRPKVIKRKWLAMNPKLITIILYVAAVQFPAIAVDFDPAPFGFYKQAEVKMQSEGIAAFPLDSEMFEHLRPDYSNLRLVRIRKDNSLEEVPFLREKFTHPRIDTRSRWINTEELSLKETDNNTIEITVRLRDKEKRAARLNIDTPLRDFERSVSVSGSRDGISWEVLVANGRIFDYARYLDIRRTEILLPKNDFQYFKVTINQAVDDKNSPIRQISRQIRSGEEVGKQITADVTSRPFRINRLNWSTEKREVTKRPKNRVPYPLNGMEVTEDGEKKETIVLLNTFKQPLTHFTLITGSKNFRRQFVVEVPVQRDDASEPQTWRILQTNKLFRYHFGNFREERLSIQFPEQRSDQYRIVIKNHDDPILQIDDFQAEGPQYRLLCLAEPNDQFRLYFGGDKGKAIHLPVYDTSAISAGRSHGLKVTAYSPKSTQDNPRYQPQKKKSSPLLDNRIFLWIAISVAVAFLTWILFSMAKKIEGLPEE